MALWAQTVEKQVPGQAIQLGYSFPHFQRKHQNNLLTPTTKAPTCKSFRILRNWILVYLFANYHLHYHKVNKMNFDWVEFTSKVN